VKAVDQEEPLRRSSFGPYKSRVLTDY
jgi:hypothetical protein